jgi:hypothetical protein
MNSTAILKLFFISFLLIIGAVLIAQPGISIYSDVGSNNVSNGIFIKSAALGFYKYGKNNFETGIQTNLKNNNKNGFSGYTIGASRNMAIKDISFRLKGFFTLTIPSETLSETNYGALMGMRHKRFEMSIGANFRTYNLRQTAVNRYEIDNTHTQIHESPNLMYSFGYNIKPTDETWNLGLSVTNIDHFNINQETNPVVNLNGTYKISPPVTLYIQACYKSAGVTNLVLNYFGYFFRTGIIWNIN